MEEEKVEVTPEVVEEAPVVETAPEKVAPEATV